MFSPPPDHLWWTKRPGYVLYIVRELSGILILIGLGYWLCIYVQVSFHPFFKDLWTPPGESIFQWIGFMGAMIHTLSWLWLSALLVPTAPKRSIKIALFILFLIGWAAISYFLYQFLYE